MEIFCIGILGLIALVVVFVFLVSKRDTTKHNDTNEVLRLEEDKNDLLYKAWKKK